MVAVKGAPNLPEIRSTEDLRKALHQLNSITSRETLVKSEYIDPPLIRILTIQHQEFVRNVVTLILCLIILQAVEVLWTPQVEHDTLSEDELLEKYPILRPI